MTAVGDAEDTQPGNQSAVSAAGNVEPLTMPFACLVEMVLGARGNHRRSPEEAASGASRLPSLTRMWAKLTGGANGLPSIAQTNAAAQPVWISDDYLAYLRQSVKHNVWSTTLNWPDELEVDSL